MSDRYELVREECVALTEASTPQTLHPSPLDIHSDMGITYLTWPFFFDYDVDAEALVKAIRTVCKKNPFLCGRILPHEETRYVIEVGTQDSTTYGVPFSELRSDMTIAAAYLKHGQIKNASADYPSNPVPPFHMERLDTEALIKGEIPIVRIRLTHFSDGCAITITAAHLLIDGQRLIELCRDLSRAYRNEEFPDRYFDRSAFWPDQLAKHYSFLGEDVASMPRKAATPKEELAFASYPEEMCDMEALYFSKDVLDGMKAAAQPFLAKGEFLSANDLLVGFAWMLRCELVAEGELAEQNLSLLLSNTAATCTVELLRNGVSIVPQEYFGNAFVLPFLSANEVDLDGKSPPELLARLAFLMRKVLTAIQTQPLVAAQSLMAYYMIVHKGAYPIDTSNGRLTMNNLSKMPFSDIDFGKGSPKIVYTPPAFPFCDPFVACSAAPDGSGIMMHLPVRQSRISRFRNSEVIKTCAPGVKYFYSEFTTEELEAMVKGS